MPAPSSVPKFAKRFASLALLSALLVPPTAAFASPGCTVLLCLAGDWRSISACVAPVRSALAGLLRGHPFPACTFATAPDTANGTRQTIATADHCPPQYRIAHRNPVTEEFAGWSCAFAGSIDVTVQGQPWNRLWWSLTGDTVTEWLPAGRAAMQRQGTRIDDRFDRDLAAWRDAEAQRLARERQRLADEQSQPTGGG